MNLQFEQTDFNQEILFYLVFGMSKLSIKLTTDKILGEQNINQIYCIINLCNQGGLIVVFFDPNVLNDGDLMRIELEHQLNGHGRHETAQERESGKVPKVSVIDESAYLRN